MQRMSINGDAVIPQILPTWCSDRAGLYLPPLQYAVIRWTYSRSVLVMARQHRRQQAHQVGIDVDRFLRLLRLDMDK